jgi:fumarate reductase flavoprotein subunit
MNKTMEDGAGIYRTEASLLETCAKLRELQERYQQVEIADHSLSFNTELTAAIELGNLLDVAEALAHGALQRQESRGSHQRTDFPQRDDQSFLKHTLAYRTEGEPPRIDYLPVVITRWPPGERVYGTKK